MKKLFRKGSSELLTGKLHPRLRFWEYPIWMLWFLFEVLMILATLSLLEEQSWYAAGVGFVLFAPLIWPAYARIRNLLLSRQAIRVEAALHSARKGRLPAQELVKLSGIRNVRDVLKRLIAGGYLSGVSFDAQQDQVYLVHQLGLEVCQFPFVCPSCGAHGVAEAQITPVCPYCGAGLTVPKEYR